ncbi:MAG: sigma-70 family RNA polymerase sigma factor [Candidatus Hydrogenedentes bacterium]|nr:sigma-70 family RNA polymerase sigma factor [Candidatus Hydrogenedentota bacterium]
MVLALQLIGSVVDRRERTNVACPIDADVVKSVLGGDRDAFRLLVERYERPVFTLCLRMVGHRHEAEDCAQTAFLKAYMALATFRADSSFKSWIYRIASNVCTDSLRRRSRRPQDQPLDSSESLRNVSEPAADPRQSASHSEMRELVEETMATLADKYRLPLALFHLEGLDCNEISAMLNLPVSTVKTRLRRARLMLRAAIARRWREEAISEALSL